MPIRVTCPGCDKKLNVPDNVAGKAVRCPACKGAVKVPAADEDEPLAEVVPDDDPPVRKARRRDEDDRPARRPQRRRDDDEDDRPRKRRAVERLEEPDEDLPVEEIDLDAADVPDDIRDRIGDELGKNEKLFWVGMPSRRIVFLRALVIPIIGAFISLIVLGVSMVQGGTLGHVLVFGALGGLVLIGSFLTPLWALWQAGRTCYALTNKRCIVWQGGLFGGVEMENYNAARVANMWRREMWLFGNGGGDLVFRSVTVVTVTTGKHGGVSESTTYYGFLAVENVRQVERLVRDVLLS